MDEVAGNPNIPYIGDLPEELDMIDVVMGKKLNFKELPIVLPVRIRDETDVEYPDLITGNVPLFSEKLKIALDKLNVDNIDYFPVELLNEKSKKTVAKYYLGIVLGCIKCLKSGLTTDSYDCEILKNPIIDSNLVLGQRFFRLAEWPQLIIIDSKIKDILTNSKLHGVSLIKLEDYISP
jgi:hypothetical protein